MGLVRLSHLADGDLDGIRDARIVHGGRDFPVLFH